MGSFLELLQKRYTTKKYNPDLIVSDDNIEQLKQILRLSPSSINSQPWKFLFISNPDTKNKLAELSYHNIDKVKNASHLVVFEVINDIHTFEDRIYKELPEGAINYYNSMIKPQEESKIKSRLTNQVYISLGVFLSACAALDIDATPMEGIDKEGYNHALGLDEYSVLFAVAIGYRDKDDSNQPSLNPKSRLDTQKIIETI